MAKLRDARFEFEKIEIELSELVSTTAGSAHSEHFNRVEMAPLQTFDPNVPRAEHVSATPPRLVDEDDEKRANIVGE